MELEFSAEEREFRDEVRAFLGEKLPPDLKERVARDEQPSIEELKSWHSTLYEKGWAAPGWPRDHGGPGWTITQRHIFGEECAAADAPPLMPFGLTMVAPVIYTFGTAEQKARFLPRILSGEDFWCQGYSEPGAGSDLASLKTRAKLDGDHFVIDGQKTWTSVAQHANMMFCLVRTRQTGKPQEGISFLLIDMKTPGITVRPIITIDGGHHVNDVFFDAVRVPKENLVGEIDKGWTYAKFLLGHERVGQAEIARNKRRLERVKDMAREVVAYGRPLIENDDFANRLADIEVDLLGLEYLSLRALANQAAGRGGGAEASFLKIKGTDLNQAINQLACEAAGYGALPMQLGRPRGNLTPLGDVDGTGLMETLLYSRAKSIWGGSNEIQRNVIAKQVLGL
jgi:alkylation response protein AidB-like acyl-CoA dehydrogenase